jgi:hypothetical protein
MFAGGDFGVFGGGIRYIIGAPVCSDMPGAAIGADVLVTGEAGDGLIADNADVVYCDGGITLHP